ncbi:hypothetical protein [Chryseolinea soli]|uniref:Uncharacterized protein n=1 Tax=Chryseolinea soli TaxID=2321403 RepID=A0A385SUL9_9BACT|nr:hypothetical protein [Chryseolinea soli]AYB32498.1 hypothetical protein D4L85_18805 [Chryseolinea soli]
MSWDELVETIKKQWPVSVALIIVLSWPMYAIAERLVQSKLDSYQVKIETLEDKLKEQTESMKKLQEKNSNLKIVISENETNYASLKSN